MPRKDQTLLAMTLATLAIVAALTHAVTAADLNPNEPVTHQDRPPFRVAIGWPAIDDAITVIIYVPDVTLCASLIAPNFTGSRGCWWSGVVAVTHRLMLHAKFSGHQSNAVYRRP